MKTLIRIALVVLLGGCATGSRPTPDVIFRHPVTGDVQWCDKPSGVGMALGGAIAGVAQGADYAACKTNWGGKGYARLDSTAKLSAEDQRRYEEERERMNKALADSIRKK